MSSGASEVVPQPKNHLRLVIVVVLVAVIGALVAIPLLTGQSHSTTGDTRPAPSPYTTPVDTSFTLADQAFVDFAASQVQEAVNLAAIAAHHTLPPGLAQLAERIHTEQSYELAYLYEMLSKWDLLQMHQGHGHPTPGGLQPGQIELIDALPDGQFAAAWAAAMSKHHEGAIYLAQGELQQGANPEAQLLARSMLENAQTDQDLLAAYADATGSTSPAATE